MNFNSFNLGSSIDRAIEKSGYTTPTPIQQEAIPVILAGTDIVGLAQTGTGKTAAYVLPMLSNLLANPAKKGVRALILAPTRELAEQINQVIRTLGFKSGLTSTTVYGGTSMNAQMRALKNGVDIVVACPGRLLDHVRRRTINLKNVDLFVLDEADQMFDMGFLPDVKLIAKEVPQKRQTLLFSATMPPELRQLGEMLLTDPTTIKIGTTAPATTISHSIIGVDSTKKTPLLLELLKTTEGTSILVFTKTKHKAQSLARDIERSGVKATSLQGNLSQGRRREALEGFKKGRYKVLVATDIASRGIDVANVSHVINYDIPGTPEAYTHRIGRTGRANRTGEALTFIGKEDFRALRVIEKTLGSAIDQKSVDGFDSPTVFEQYQMRGSRGGSGAERSGRPQNRSRRPKRYSSNNSRSGGGRSSKSW